MYLAEAIWQNREHDGMNRFVGSGHKPGHTGAETLQQLCRAGNRLLNENYRRSPSA